ncbi:MAG: YceI family protein [Cyclobacteriaceae bacterium]|nr:YceI family protein [Cyclobacteriaceae bacterium]
MLQVIAGLLILFNSSHYNVPIQNDQQIDGIWTIVPEKSMIGFKIPVMFIFPVEGSFTGVSGTIEIGHNLLEAEVDLTIDPATIDTRNEKRDEHLRSEDFFYVEKYPEIIFSASRIAKQAVENRYTVEGELTIRDVTKTINVPVTLEEINEEGEIVFSGSKNINRREFNIDYSGRGLGDTAELDFRIVAVRK